MNRREIRKKTRRGVEFYVARFFDLGSRYPVESTLCKVAEAETRQGSKREAFLKKLYAQKKREAVEKLKIKFREAKESETTAPLTEADRHTFGEAVKKYEAEVLINRTFRYQKKVSSQLEHWQSHLGNDTPLSKITPARIQAAKEKIARLPRHSRTGETIKPASVNRYLAGLSAVLQACVKDWFWLENNPAHKIRYASEPVTKSRFLSQEELARLMNVTKSNPPLHLAIQLALTIGARQADIWGLKWKQVDMERKLIVYSKTTATKTTKPRSVPLLDSVFELLLQHPKEGEFVFPSKVSDKTYFDFRNPWKKALKAAQIENFRWHDLRHTAASYLAMSGVPMRTIGEILGQATTTITERYSHLSPEHLKKSLNSLKPYISG